MTNLEGKFATLEDQLAAQNAAILGAMSDVNDTLGLLNTALDTLNNNAAVNTRYLLAAIGANNPCQPCPTPPLVIPPVGTTTAPVDEDRCKRAQAFIAFMQQAFTVLDLASAIGIGFNPTLITDAYNQVIASLSGGDSPDTISFPEAVQLVGDLISYVATNLGVGGTLSGSFAPLIFELRDAMYITTDAASAKAAYDSVVNASGAGTWVVPVMRNAAYGAAYTYFFDPASDPDLTGFDGSICGFPAGTCYTIDLVVGHFDNGSVIAGIAEAFGPFTPVSSINTSSGMVTSDTSNFFAGDLTGWTFEILIGHGHWASRIGNLASAGLFDIDTNRGVDGLAHPCPSPTGSFFFIGDDGGRVRICKT